jgi:3-oxoacyl-[acyl-carrier-protein] synthase-3
MQEKAIGILGVGTHLPPQVRQNNWWPDHVVQSWREKAARRMEKLHDALVEEKTEGARRTLEALAGLAKDPFQGARERRVIGDDTTAADMETIAAREAIARAGIPQDEIDLVLSHQICPDYINVPSAAVVHGNLGLSEHCTTMGTDAACNSFMLQLTLARGMIASGQARYALLTQSSTLTRFPDSGEMIDAWGGDGASAVVVGPVSPGRGILSFSNHTNGKLWGALVCGVPGRRWQDDRCVIYSEDRAANLDMVVRIADRAKRVIDESLGKAGLSPRDVAFFAGHQGFKWLLPVTQAYAGLGHARSVEHFHYTGTVSSVNLPLQMAVAEKEGILKPGDVVTCFQGGTGMTWSGMTLRWGT